MVKNSGIVYRIRGDTLSHAYKSKYSGPTKYSTYKAVSKSDRYKGSTHEIVGRKEVGRRDSARTTNPYGQYKSPYYDPVYRHNYYESHKDHQTRPYGVGDSSSGKGSKGGKGGSGKSGRGGSGKGSKGGKGKKNNVNLSETIKALREESSLNTEAQREATKRKIEDLKKQLKAQTDRLAGMREDQEEGVNAAEIRGRIQAFKDQIQQAGGDLQTWVSHEKDALERRIAAIYSKHGKKYTVTTQTDKQQASKKRDKEVNSRADAIYKRRKK